jgi:hypothetical protein
MNASRLVIDGCVVAPVDPNGSEYESGHVVEGNRIMAVGQGLMPEEHTRNTRRLTGRAEEVAL